MKRLLSILVASAGCAFAGPNVRVSIDGEGKGVGLVAQAYEVRLRNIPGIVPALDREILTGWRGQTNN